MSWTWGLGNKYVFWKLDSASKLQHRSVRNSRNIRGVAPESGLVLELSRQRLCPNQLWQGMAGRQISNR